METPNNRGYAKRTQKDYTMSFKLQVVQELESGELSRVQAMDKYGIQASSTLRSWLKKYGTFDWEYDKTQLKMKSKSPEQRILELEAKVKLLEKQKARAEALAHIADEKVIIFDMLVDMAEKEYDIAIRKNYKPELSTSTQKKDKKQ
ncbi:MAG: helix-turn-helix domain-containing protein [Weeksellaceae bacterium]